MNDKQAQLLSAIGKRGKCTVSDMYFEIGMSVASAFLELEELEKEYMIGHTIVGDRCYWSLTMIGRRALNATNR